MKHMSWKDFFREIKDRNRFLSVLLIVALGFALYGGIRAANSDPQSTADAYFDRTRLMDIRVLGTQGMTDEDVAAISQVAGVQNAQGAYETEALYQNAQTQLVLRVFSLCDDLNQMTVAQGRLPVEPDECFVDEKFVEATGLRIGDTFAVVPGTAEDIGNTLEHTEFTITGYGTYAWYPSQERGAASIGDGTLDAFVAVPKGSFVQQAYTTVYALVEGAEQLSCYSDTYQARIDDVVGRIEAIAGERCQIRISEMRGEAEQKIADAQKQQTEAKAKVDQKWNEAENSKTQLTQKRQAVEQLEKSTEQIEAQEREYQEGDEALSQRQQQADQAQEAIADGWEQYNQRMASVEKTRAQIEQGEAELALAEENQERAQAAFQEQFDSFNYMKTSIDTTAKDWDMFRMTVNQYQWMWQQIQAGVLPEDDPIFSSLKSFLDGFNAILGRRLQIENADAEDAGRLIAAVEDGALAAGMTADSFFAKCVEETVADREQALATAKGELDATKAQIDKKRQALADGRKALNESRVELEAIAKQLTERENSLEEETAQLAAQRQQLADARAQWEEGKAQLEQQLADARAEMLEEEREYQNALAEYEGQKAHAETEMANAEGNIESAENEISELQTSQWTVLDRQSIQTYVAYGMDAKQRETTETMFPILFLLAAALIGLIIVIRVVRRAK